MKKILNKILYYLLIFFLMISIFNVLLYLVCSFNSKLLYHNVLSSYEVLREQGLIYQLNERLNLTVNNYTDSLIVNSMYSIDSKVPFESYMKMRKNYKNGLTKLELDDITGESKSVRYYENIGETMEDAYDTIGELEDFLNGKIHTSINYARYWHGNTLLYRPLLIFLNITQIRYLLFSIFLILLFYFIYLLNKNFGKNIFYVFLASLICNGYLSAAFSLESAPIFLTMIISSIFLLKRINRIRDFNIYIFIVACIANFMDYLTVPLITLCVPVSIYILKLLKDKKNWKYCINFIIINSIIWFLGYSMTWLFKWVLYDVFISHEINVLKLGFRQVLFRTQRENPNVLGYNYFITIFNLVRRSSLYFGITILVMICLNKFNVHSSGFNKKVIPFLLLSLFPILWYIALANHTLIHHHFIYRHCMIYRLGLLLAINEMFFKENSFINIKMILNNYKNKKST